MHRWLSARTPLEAWLSGHSRRAGLIHRSGTLLLGSRRRRLAKLLLHVRRQLRYVGVVVNLGGRNLEFVFLVDFVDPLDADDRIQPQLDKRLVHTNVGRL